MNEQDTIIISKLRQLKGIQPKNEWRVLFKEKLNAELNLSKTVLTTSAETAAKEKKFIFFNNFSRILYFPRLLALPRATLAGVAIVSLFMIYGGTFVSYSTANSLPGDALYPVKLASEKVKFALAPDEENRVVLRFEFINNRLSEMGATMGLNEPEDIKTDRVTVAVNAIKKEMNDINTDFDKFDKKVGAKEPVKTVKMAKNIDETITSYSKTLTAAMVNLPNSVKEKTKTSVSETIKIAEETSNKTLMVLIERHNEAPIISKDELMHRVEQKIANTEAKLKDVQEKAQTLANDSMETKGAVDSGTSALSVNADSKVNKTSGILSNEARVMLTEARVKLQTNDLSGAFKNAEASESIVKATENIIDASSAAAVKPTDIPVPSVTSALTDVIVSNGKTEENKQASSFVENPLIPLKTVIPSVVPDKSSAPKP